MDVSYTIQILCNLLLHLATLRRLLIFFISWEATRLHNRFRSLMIPLYMGLYWTLQALAAQLAGYCSVRLCLASGHLPSMKVLVIQGTVILSFGQEFGGFIRQL